MSLQFLWWGILVKSSNPAVGAAAGDCGALNLMGALITELRLSFRSRRCDIRVTYVKSYLNTIYHHRNLSGEVEVKSKVSKNIGCTWQSKSRGNGAVSYFELPVAS